MLTRKQIWQKVAVFACLFLFPMIGIGQAAAYTVKGKVIDTTGAPLIRATVKIEHGSESYHALTKEDGTFEIARPQADSFRLLISMKGYASYDHLLPANNQSLTIILQPEYQQLGTVIIGHLRTLSVRGDTASYYAGAYALREGSGLTDLVRFLPGMSLIPDSGLIVMGKKVRRVLLDGKPFYNGDVMTALKSLPYDLIDKVEVIDDYGDESRLTAIRTHGPEKVLNIILKKDKTRGYSGSVEGGGGNNGRYIGTLLANIFRGDEKFSVTAVANNNNDYGPDYVKWLGLNYINAWSHGWSTSIDGHAFLDDYRKSSSFSQDNFYNTGSTHQESGTTSHVTNLTQYAGYSILYTPPENSQAFRITGAFTRQYVDQLDQTNVASLQTDSGFHKQATSDTRTQLNTVITKSENNLYYNKMLSHSGQRFSIDASLNYADNLQHGDYQTQTHTDSGNATDEQSRYLVVNDTRMLETKGIFHYYFPIGKTGLLEARYGWHTTGQKNDRDWRTPLPNNDGWQKQDSLSNDFSYRTVDQLGYVGYGRHGDKADLRVGLSLIPIRLTASLPTTWSHTTNDLYFLPDAAFQYNLSKTKKFGLSYTPEVMLPMITQVTPTTDVSIPQYPVTGSPGLKAAIKQSTGLLYEYNNLQPIGYHAMTAGITYTFIQNPVAANIVHPDDTSVVIQHTYYTNVSGTHDWRFDYRFETPFPGIAHLQFSAWGTADWMRSTTLADSIASPVRTLSIMQYVTLQYTLPPWTTFKWSTGYTRSSTTYLNGNSAPFTSTELEMRFDQDVYFLRRWKAAYILLLKWSAFNVPRLAYTPAYLTASLERSFLKHNQLTLSLSGSNLLNAQAGIAQAATANSVTQYHSTLAGRNLILSLKWSFESFKTKKSKIR